MPAVKVECFAFWIYAMVGLFQKSCSCRLSNLCCPHDTAIKTKNKKTKPCISKILFSCILWLFNLFHKISWTKEELVVSNSLTSGKKCNFQNFGKKTFISPDCGFTRLWNDSSDKLVATAGLQVHSFSAQWTVHWGVEVGPNQNQGAHDLIFCSINTFLFGSRTTCHAAPVAIFIQFGSIRKGLTVLCQYWSGGQKSVWN